MHAWMWKHYYALSRVPYLEYFADKKPLRMSQISRKIDQLLQSGKDRV